MNSMTPTKSEPVDAAAALPPASKTAPRSQPVRPAATERGTPIEVVANRTLESGRVILYERLTGVAARERARGTEPQGAGMPAEEVARVEYLEVWSTPPPANGYDFRMYSFGGALLATRSTRS
jgi:hypothetical protein